MRGMRNVLATTVQDLGCYFVAVWTGVVVVAGVLAGLAPWWRRVAARCGLTLDG